MDQKQSQLPRMKIYRWRWTFGLKKKIDVRENNYTGDFGIQHTQHPALRDSKEWLGPQGLEQDC